MLYEEPIKKIEYINRVRFVVGETAYELLASEINTSKLSTFLTVSNITFETEGIDIELPCTNEIKKSFEKVHTSFIPLSLVVRIDVLIKPEVRVKLTNSSVVSINRRDL